MLRRMLDGLLVLWVGGGILLLCVGQNLWAAPIGCDNDCRHVLVVAADRGAPLGLRCTRYKYTDCYTCVSSGGCLNNLPAIGGTCVEDTTLVQEEARPTCAILCPNPVQMVTYEAHTNDTDFNFVPALNRWWCAS